MKSQSWKSKSSISDTFINTGKMQSVVEEAKQIMFSSDQAPRQISDVIDSEGNQYVDLVLEGGGTLGVALLGYLYVLEECGIRFARIGGTSAGSIVSLLMAATPIQEKKVETILEDLLRFELLDFIDLHQYSIDILDRLNITDDRSKIIQALSKSKKDNSRASLIEILATPISKIGKGMSYLTLLDNFYSAYKNYGIAKGAMFLEWLTSCLKERNIETLGELFAVRKIKPQGLSIRPERSTADIKSIPKRFRDLNNWNPEICIISAEITTQTKVEFPRHADLFWAKPELINPALFVRASMSIPLFYEPLVVKLENKSKELSLKWLKEVNYKGTLPNEFYFVDGGVISNFPIGVFHDTTTVPVTPTFGVKIGFDRDKTNVLNTFTEYISALFNTSRAAMDFDFIHRNEDYNKLIQYIDVASHHWLNFTMTESDKIDLFTRGAISARDFLYKFDWDKYKLLRQSMLEPT